MTGEQTEVIEHAARSGRDPRWRRFVTAMLAVLALSVAALGVVLVEQFGTTSDLHGQVAALSAAQATAARDGQQLAGQLRALGATPVVSPPTPIQGAQGPPGVQGPGPSQQQIDDSVSHYFAVNPPGATPAMVAVQVAQFLTAHPPVTQDQITTAASDFIGAHPELFRGQPGATGATGQSGADATDAQVASAVAAFCGAHSNCAGAAGPAGAQGSQGISVSDLQFARDSSGACQVVITLHDPATNADTTITHPAGDAACPILPLIPKK